MKKKILNFISILFIIIFSTTSVSALDLAKYGDSVLEEGEYDSVRFIAGNNIINKANIDGLSFIAGNEITTEGTTSYGLYAGNNINIKENIIKDLFVAGNKIILYEEAVIERDALIAGANVTIMTNIARDLRVGADNINISGITIEGDAYLYADNITLDENTTINGKLTYPEDANIKGLNSAKVGEIVTTKKGEIEVKKSNKIIIKNIILSICAGIITMLILFYMLPKTKERLDKVELKIDIIVKNICIGFLILILVPMIFIMTVFTNILTPIAIILACIYGISIYLGALLSAYIIGSLLTKKVFNKDNKYLALLVGIIIVRLAKLIPYIGSFIGVICFLYGMGLITKYIKARNM